MLIGLDFYYSFVTRDIVKGGPSEPVAVRTSLGWVSVVQPVIAVKNVVCQ